MSKYSNLPIDFLIIGSGISGSLCAMMLRQLNKTFKIFDDSAQSNSSSIAAGLINPITGRHFVKSWKIEQLLEVANQVYGELEARYDIKIQHDLKIIRALKSPSMINEWSAREIDPDYTNFIQDQLDIISPGINQDSSYGVIKGAKRIDFHEIMLLLKKILSNSQTLIEERFDFEKVLHNDEYMKYGDLIFRNLIFCEGSEARLNPLWNWLPFVPAKGERLIIKSPGLKLQEVYNDGKVIIPLGDDQYWVGSNYEWNALDNQPSERIYHELRAFLDKTLAMPYEIVDHAAHIRPSTYNRRPFVGRHPNYSNCYILNGLGAKGASLAPYCVKQLIDHMLHGAAIDEEIAVGRQLPSTGD